LLRILALTPELQTTTGSEHLHMAAADPSAGFAALVEELSGQFSLAGVSAEKAEVNDWNSEWDILYPFSAVCGFLRYLTSTDEMN
jgi:hypothetical protein